MAVTGIGISDDHLLKILGFRLIPVAAGGHLGSKIARTLPYLKMLREGKLEWLLGVRYYFDEKKGAASCNQKSNIENILNKYGMRDCNAAP